MKEFARKTGGGWPSALLAFGTALLMMAGCVAVSAYPRMDVTALATPNGVTAPVSLLPTPTTAPTASRVDTETAAPVRIDPVVMTATPVLAATPASSLVGLLPTPTVRALLPTATPVTAAAITAAPTPDSAVRTVRLPILMYHYLSTPPTDADIYRQDLSVPPELFAAHLDRLLAEGYTTISLYQLQAHLMRGAPLPEKPVIITFDDGYRDNYENAFPLLRERSMTATFFVVTDFIDEERPAYLTWEMVRAMQEGGMSIESHGRNHVSLEGKDADYLVWQALGSLETIAHELGTRPRFVSYPAGEFDQRTIEIFQSAGYWAGLTTVQGATQRSDDPFRMQRVRVRNTTTAEELSRLLALEW